jgi:hypothetical protein
VQEKSNQIKHSAIHCKAQTELPSSIALLLFRLAANQSVPHLHVHLFQLQHHFPSRPYCLALALKERGDCAFFILLSAGRRPQLILVVSVDDQLLIWLTEVFRIKLVSSPHSAELLLWPRQHLGRWVVFSAAFHHTERAPRVTSSLTAELPTVRSLKTSLVSIQGLSPPVSCAQGRLVKQDLLRGWLVFLPFV